MGLSPGTRLGPYEIVAPLGAGGMGEVYRARDSRLDRTVAIKILYSQLTESAALHARFEREAKIISQLQHPNICVLHDVGSDGATEYLVMEFLDGETLAKRLEKGPLAGTELLRIAIEVADALEKAHRQGVIHRDLKPGNIMLTKSGAKLMDFGLAKSAIAGAGAAPPLSSLTQSLNPAGQRPTEPLTAAGTIVGTFQYMSPEQMEGKETDARSDIFSFGAVLFEMATGKRAFDGKTTASVIAAILEREPPTISSLQPMSPPALDRVVKVCLAKEPDERFQSMHDVKLQLEWIRDADSQAGVPTPVVAQRRARERITWVVAAALLLIIAMWFATGYFLRAPLSASQSPLMVSVIPPTGVSPETDGRNGSPQISPDGRSLAFVGCRSESAAASSTNGKNCSIWVQRLDSTEAYEIAGTSGGFAPFWSPNGHDIGFFADGKLKRVAADGGPIQILCDVEDARGGSWGNSGVIIFSATRGSPIFRVSADGGVPVAITRPAPASNLSQVGSHRWPHFLPDGQHFVYVNSPNGACSDQSELRFASLDGKQNAALMLSCGSADFAAGRLIYWRDGNLVAQSFDPRRGLLSGAAVPIVAHVAMDSLYALADFSASADGKLAYVAGEGPALAAQLIWYDRAGKTLGTVGDGNEYDSVSISPDGSRIVANSVQPDETAIMILDDRGTRVLATLPSGSYSFPIWSADGRRVYFTSNGDGPFDIFVKDADGSGDARKVVAFEKNQLGAQGLAASPDGKFLAYETWGSGTARKLEIYTVALKGEVKPYVFVDSATGDSEAPAFSPDGKWLAFESRRSGRAEVYITAFPAGGAQYQVSTDGGVSPVWRRDGKEIFYRELIPSRLMAVEVNSTTGTIRLGVPKPLFEAAPRTTIGRWYDVSPDGRFLINGSTAKEQVPNFGLVVNWPALVKKQP